MWLRLSEHIPLCRDGEPGEFGWAAVFVLSPASHITGAMIPVDGGAGNSSWAYCRGGRRRCRLDDCVTLHPPQGVCRHAILAPVCRAGGMLSRNPGE